MTGKQLNDIHGLVSNVRESGELYRIILDSLKNGIVSVNDRGQIITVNRAAKKILGLPLDHPLEGTVISEIFNFPGFSEALESGQELVNQKLTINGKKLIYNCSPIYYEGKVVGATATFQEISDLDHIATELESYKNLVKQLELIIESSYDGIYVTNSDGTTAYVNSAYERMTGLKREELIGRPVKELEDEGYFKPAVSLIVLEKKKRVTILQKNKNGKQLTATGNPVFDENGNLLKVVINFRDISEIVNLRNQLEESQQLAKLYALELKRLRQDHNLSKNIIFQSKKMQKVMEMALTVAEVDATVLLLGESGVGKEEVAKIIHESGPRFNQPFVKINCASIPENLIETELFGYEGGAFTGAKQQGKVGLLEVAGRGTVLLDEIAELSPNLQGKLLRVLQEQEFYRVSGTTPIKMKARVIASTNRNLEKMISEGRFREDLYYRLNVVPIYIPPLRERKEDISLLAGHFLEMFNQKYGRDKRISMEALELLDEYDWPGNVRELANLIEHLVIISPNSLITVDDLPTKIKGDLAGNKDVLKVNSVVPLKEATEMLEKNLIRMAVSREKTFQKAALALGVDPSTVFRKIKKYKLNIPK